MKPHPEDAIWQTIIASARSKFDYTHFCKAFGAFENDRVLDTVLFLVVEGFAENRPAKCIAGDIRDDLSMLGYAFADQGFESFVLDHQQIFAVEIEAAIVALRLLEGGEEISGIVREAEGVLSG